MSWLDAFLTAYNAAQADGVPVIQRPTFNFVGDGVSVADDPITKVTTITVDATPVVGTQISADLAATVETTPSGTQTIDGEFASVGEVVLLTGQDAPEENGLWTVALGTWTRTDDTIARGMAVYIQGGTANAGATFTLLGSGPIVVGTTELQFANLRDEFDVRLFGAVVDGVTDDGDALRLAMAAVKANGRGTILLPHGTMLVDTSGYTGVNTCGMLVDCDNVRVRGQGPEKSIILMGTGCDFVPMLVQKMTIGVDLAPLAVEAPQFEEFTIQYTDRGPASAGSIQINNGQNFLVSKVRFVGDGLGMDGIHVDGLAMAFESTGRFTRVLVDGLSKGGIYLALCKSVVGDGEVKNCYGTFQVGCQISGAYDCDLSLDIHDNSSPSSGGVGVLWFVNTGLTPTISTLTSQTDFVLDFGTPFGDVYARYLGVFNTDEMCMEALDVASVSTSDGGTHYHVLLNTAPAQTLSVSDTLIGDYQPCKNVTVRGTFYNLTNQGVSGASAITGGFGRDVTLDGCIVHDCGSYGINPTSIKGLLINNCTVERCSAGIFAADVGPNDTVEGLCSRIRVVGGRYRDNGGSGTAGIYLSAVDDVSISSSVEISTSDVAATQGVGILVQGKNVAQPKACTVTASTNLVTATLHGYVAGNGVVFDTTANGITGGIVYYVLASGLTANDFKISLTEGGAAVDITSDGSNIVRRWKKCTNVKIGHFTDTGYATSQVYHPLGSADAPDTGYYNHPLHSGSPNGGYYAPPGSELPDSSTGQSYIKSGSGAIATNWNRVVRDDDTSAAATASKIALRDANADGFFRYVQVSGGVANAAGGIFYSVLAGSTHLFGDSSFNSIAAMSLTAFTLGMPLVTGVEGNNLTIGINQRTTDAAIKALALAGQAPYASATGSNRNSGSINVTIQTPVAGGTAGTFNVSVAGTQMLQIGPTKPSIAGVLSAVVDANAKAVLTSIIAALVVTTGINVVTDGTT